MASSFAVTNVSAAEIGSFAPMIGMGGSKVVRANDGANKGTPDQKVSAGKDVPIMDHAVDTAAGRIDQGVKSASDGIGGLIDATGDKAMQVGVIGAAVASHYAAQAAGNIWNGMQTQGPSFQFDPAPNPANDPSQNAALMQTMHELTYAKAMLSQAGVKFDNVALSDANLSEIRDMTTNIQEARQFAQQKSEQSAGMAVG